MNIAEAAKKSIPKTLAIQPIGDITSLPKSRNFVGQLWEEMFHRASIYTCTPADAQEIQQAAADPKSGATGVEIRRRRRFNPWRKDGADLVVSVRFDSRENSSERLSRARERLREKKAREKNRVDNLFQQILLTRTTPAKSGELAQLSHSPN